MKVFTLACVFVLAGAIFSSAVTKAAPADFRQIGKIGTSDATSSLMIKAEYKSVAAKVEKEGFTLLNSAPLVDQVRMLSEGKFKTITISKDYIEKERTNVLVIRFTLPNQLPESLMEMTETHKVCHVVKDDCKDIVKLVLKAPFHSYQSVVDVHSGPALKGLQGAFDISFEVTQSMDANHKDKLEMTSTMTINHRGYMAFFQKLQREKIIPIMPTEEQVKKGFLLWAGTAMKLFASGKY